MPPPVTKMPACCANPLLPGQARKAASPPQPGTSNRLPLPLDDASSAYGTTVLGETGGGVRGVSAGAVAAVARHNSLRAGEWTKVRLGIRTAVAVNIRV